MAGDQAGTNDQAGRLSDTATPDALDHAIARARLEHMSADISQAPVTHIARTLGIAIIALFSSFAALGILGLRQVDATWYRSAAETDGVILSMAPDTAPASTASSGSPSTNSPPTIILHVRYRAQDGTELRRSVRVVMNRPYQAGRVVHLAYQVDNPADVRLPRAPQPKALQMTGFAAAGVFILSIAVLLLEWRQRAAARIASGRKIS